MKDEMQDQTKNQTKKPNKNSNKNSNKRIYLICRVTLKFFKRKISYFFLSLSININKIYKTRG